ncbi:MAG: hypothetical protein B6I26_04535 [Desulfobacteraceae bacterium 4572_130]|nr:MAG: hypothetical protein B6I26_04535 [Desulfobacteraceae bacterium 4572_130]
MTLTKVKTRHQITLPRVFREELNIKEGDYLEIIRQDDKLVIIPKTTIPKTQAYFWTKKWQKGEKQADKDIKQGNVSKVFNNAEDFIKDLKS